MPPAKMNAGKINKGDRIGLTAGIINRSITIRPGDPGIQEAGNADQNYKLIPQFRSCLPAGG
jgi:hypothetical protein